MLYFYSPSTKGFYIEELHGDKMPGDVVSISEEEHSALMHAQDRGYVIQPGPDGRPLIHAQQLPSPEQQRKKLADFIDKTVSEVYAKLNRFHIEDEHREMSARAFRYTGMSANVWVISFANAIGKPPEEAADIILKQAEERREILSLLAAQRMRKYQIFSAPDERSAFEIQQNILAQINHIAKRIT